MGKNMFSKDEVLKIAKAQLALDYNCQMSDFEKERNTLVENRLIEGRRIYSSDGCFLKILCFGSRAIISSMPVFMPWCEEKLLNSSAQWLFQYPRLRMIDRELEKYGHEIADAHHYYLPDPDLPCTKPVSDVRWYEYEDIFQFRNDLRFGEALAFDENRPDVLAVAGFDGDNIMGMAGASADSRTMWQIGIDVLPEYRGRGVGANLVSLLKDEILKRGKIPFYGTAESHFHSQNTAINAGFFPVWGELITRMKGEQR